MGRNVTWCKCNVMGRKVMWCNTMCWDVMWWDVLMMWWDVMRCYGTLCDSTSWDRSFLITTQHVTLCRTGRSASWLTINVQPLVTLTKPAHPHWANVGPTLAIIGPARASMYVLVERKKPWRPIVWHMSLHENITSAGESESTRKSRNLEQWSGVGKSTNALCIHVYQV